MMSSVTFPSLVAGEIENGLEAERNNQSKGESNYDSSSSEGKAVDSTK